MGEAWLRSGSQWRRRGGEDRLEAKQRGVVFDVVEEGVSGADAFRVLRFLEDDSKPQIAVGAFALQILVRERPADPLLSAKGRNVSFLRKAGMRRAFWRSSAHHDSSRREQAIFPEGQASGRAFWGDGEQTENKRRRTTKAGRTKLNGMRFDRPSVRRGGNTQAALGGWPLWRRIAADVVG